MAKIIFLMGVSGSGKTTVLHESDILNNPVYRYVQSYTTRPMRTGEVNGEKYWHVSHDEFEEAIQQGEFLEYAFVHNMHYYGTKYAELSALLDQGISPVKELDMHGLIHLQESGRLSGKYVTIFLDIPIELMQKRILHRGDISDSELQHRLESATFEINEARRRCDVHIDATQPLELVVKTFIDTLNRFDSK